jgi:rod shape-determining protein MreD
MSSSAILTNLFRFLVLLFFQVALFNKINFLGFVNPYPYVLFLLLYPSDGNRSSLMIFSFIMGLLLDMFLNSGGVHAAASVMLAYYRPYFFKFSFGLSYEYQTVKILGRLTTERVSFLAVTILFHHFFVFLLEAFSFTLFLDVFIKTISSSVFTLLISLLLIYLFKPVRK